MFSNALTIANVVLFALLVLCYAYQMLYLFIPFFVKMPKHKGRAKKNRLAVLISARNEERVIGEILDCLAAQDYPKELTTLVVVADNCTDSTAAVAREHGAIVYERQDPVHIGKGYALDFVLGKLKEDYGEDFFDAFVVFDADNLMANDFLTEINKTFSDGYEVVAGYRNSKNYGDNWISAGCGLWFLRDARFLNGSRMRIGASCQIAGTGFLFSNKLKKHYGGFPFHLLTEDYELTACAVADGFVFGYCEEARFYDEQTASFRQSWRQRVRWSKGGIQVFLRYGKRLIRGIFSKKFFSCYDMTMAIAPAFFLSLTACAVNLIGIPLKMIEKGDFLGPLVSAGLMVLLTYGILWVNALVTTLAEWRQIHTTAGKKILYTFTFPLFMFTFIPIAFIALVKKVEWKPIEHKAQTLDEVLAEDRKNA